MNGYGYKNWHNVKFLKKCYRCKKVSITLKSNQLLLRHWFNFLQQIHTFNYHHYQREGFLSTSALNYHFLSLILLSMQYYGLLNQSCLLNFFVFFYAECINCFAFLYIFNSVSWLPPLLNLRYKWNNYDSSN